MRKVWSWALEVGGSEARCPQEAGLQLFLPLPVPCATGNFLVPPEKAINKIGHGKQELGGH